MAEEALGWSASAVFPKFREYSLRESPLVWGALRVASLPSAVRRQPSGQPSAVSLNSLMRSLREFVPGGPPWAHGDTGASAAPIMARSKGLSPKLASQRAPPSSALPALVLSSWYDGGG